MPDHFKSSGPPLKILDQIQNPEPPQAPLSPEPVMNSEQEYNGLLDKIMISGTSNGGIKLSATNTNQTDTTDDQSLTSKKVVKVVRRVVRKVLPMEEISETTKPFDKAPEAAKGAAESVKTVPTVQVPVSVSKATMMSGFSFKHDIIKTEDKDDISRGLTSLMVRGRTREPRTQMRKDEWPEKIELDKKSEIKVKKVESDETKEAHKKDKISLKPGEVSHKPTGFVQGLKSPEVSVNPASIAPSKLTHSRPSSFPPIVGFIPAPLSPPSGFIPNLKLVTDHTPRNNTTPAAQDSLSAPSHFSPGSKPAPHETPMSSEPPSPNPHPLFPTAGINPMQQHSVSQYKVQYSFLTLCIWYICSIFGTLMWKVHGHLKCMFKKSTVLAVEAKGDLTYV